METKKTASPEPLSVRQLARAKGVTLGTIYAQIWAARIPAVKRGRKWEISPDAAILPTQERAKEL